MASRKKTGARGHTSGSRQAASNFPLRIAAGLGDPGRERQILAALSAEDDLVIAERCLSADQLLSVIRQGQIDAVLVASDLHRLSGDRLVELERVRVPMVILAPDPEHERWEGFPGVVLAADAGPEIVRQGILAAVRGERTRPVTRRDDATEPAEPTRDVEDAPSALSIITVASGPGSPGRTTVALNLAAALGAVAPTVLVDADLAGPSVAVYLDLDPTRNLAMLAHGEPETAGDWQRAITQEVQPLDTRSPRGVVLCGIPRPEMRGRLSVRFFDRLIAELRQRYRYVILDIGSDLLGQEVGVHRAAIGLAQQVLVVASGDLVGLWRAKSTLGSLSAHREADPDRVALVINRHDRRHHHGGREIEWALGVPVAAVVPHDHRKAQHALVAQRPLVLHGGPAGRALLDLAERVHGGDAVLPLELADHEGGWIGRAWPFRSPQAAARAEEGARDGDYATRPS